MLQNYKITMAKGYVLITTIVLLYCIMRQYAEGRLDRYRIGILREMSEIRTQPCVQEVSLRFLVTTNLVDG